MNPDELGVHQRQVHRALMTDSGSGGQITDDIAFRVYFKKSQAELRPEHVGSSCVSGIAPVCADAVVCGGTSITSSSTSA